MDVVVFSVSTVVAPLRWLTFIAKMVWCGNIQAHVVCRREPKRIETAWIFAHLITYVFYETVKLRRLQTLNS